MKIAYLTAGAAGMYCGSCMNDNAVARELIREGHECLLIPVYTPIRTDDDDVSVGRVFLGGVNVYLQQQAGWIARLPRFVDAILNQPWLIQWLTRDAGKTSPKLLGALTISMLKGFRGKQRKEFERLLDWLDTDVRPDTILLTNLLIGGAIPAIKERLGARVFVTLQGDDIFLDSLPSQDRLQCEVLMQNLVAHVDGFIVHSHAYGQSMASRFQIPHAKIHVVPLGIDAREFTSQNLFKTDQASEPGQLAQESPRGHIVKLGYLARMAPEKGLHQIVEACERIAPSLSKDRPLHLQLAGWMGPQHVDFWEQQKSRLERVASQHPCFTWEYAGSVDRAGKIAFLRSIDLFCVPTVYAEPKGRFLLEAVCMGLPYVMPDHGAFPELHRRMELAAGHPVGQIYQHDSMEDLVAVLQQAIDAFPRRQPVPEPLTQELDMATHARRLLDFIRT